MNISAYVFFAGLDGGGNPLWTSDASQREPAFEDPNGVGWNASVSFNADLSRYFLITQHTDSGDGLMGMFDAPTPWGPWTMIEYYDASKPFGAGYIDGRTFFWNFSNKWTKGVEFTLVFTGTGANDSWNIVRGTFILNVAETPEPPTAVQVD